MKFGAINTSKEAFYLFLNGCFEGHWVRWRAAGTSVSATGLGGTLYGTGADAPDNTTKYHTRSTSNTAPTPAGVEPSTFTEVRSNHDPVFECVIKTGSDITNVRYWIGFLSSTTANTDNQSGSNIAFRFSTVAGDTGWRPIVDNGTTQTVGTNIGTVTASTQYKLRLRIDFANTKSYFSVDDGTEQEISAIPLSGADMAPVAMIFNTSNGIKDIHFSRLQFKAN